VYADYQFYALQDREIREQELAERMAEKQEAGADCVPQTLPASQDGALSLHVSGRRGKRPGTWFGRGWKRREVYETKRVARSSRARGDAPDPP
jgi:hypothetical protein